MKKLLYLSALSICLYTPYVVLAAESGITFDSSLFDETPTFGSLLALDESSSPTYDISASEEDMLLFFDEEDLFLRQQKPFKNYLMLQPLRA
jgi:hypothetical protein